MRSSILFVAPFVAAAFAQSTDTANATVSVYNSLFLYQMLNLAQVIEASSGSTTVSTTVPYTNGFTSYLTETNSLGVVTGMPSVVTSQPSQPAAVTAQSSLPTGVTTQPVVATIPAGLPSGTNTVVLNISSSLTSFLVSVGSSTTAVIGDASVSIAAATNATGTAASGSTATGSGSSASGSAASGSNTASSSSSSSTSNAAVGNVQVASAGLIGLGALFAALL